MCDTPSHGSDHLWLIWKESIQNCRCYRADTAAGTDGRTDRRTDRRTEWNQYTPQQLRCSGGIITRNYFSSNMLHKRIHYKKMCLLEKCNGCIYTFQKWNWRKPHKYMSVYQHTSTAWVGCQFIVNPDGIRRRFLWNFHNTSVAGNLEQLDSKREFSDE